MIGKGEQEITKDAKTIQAATKIFFPVWDANNNSPLKITFDPWPRMAAMVAATW